VTDPRQNLRYLANSYVAGNNRFWPCSHEAFLKNLPLIPTMSGYSWWKKEDSFSRVNSETFSVELVVAGDARYVQNKREYIVEPGQVFLVHKGKNNEFTTGPAGFLHKRMVIMEGVMLAIVLRSLGLLDADVVTCKNPLHLIAQIKRLNRAMSNQGPGSSWELSLQAYGILLEVGQSIQQSSYPPEISKALTYMSLNINRNLSLEEISRASGVSMYHFSRMFHKSMNAPPMTFFFQQKMQLAKSLLLDTNLLIKEIATLAGFDDPFYFSTQFSSFFGVSPREFRKRRRGNR
jgi:AraC-like DNA-binding protein